jgi:hypothetical protein
MKQSEESEFRNRRRNSDWCRTVSVGIKVGADTERSEGVTPPATMDGAS